MCIQMEAVANSCRPVIYFKRRLFFSTRQSIFVDYMGEVFQSRSNSPPKPDAVCCKYKHMINDKSQNHYGNWSCRSIKFQIQLYSAFLFFFTTN